MCGKKVVFFVLVIMVVMLPASAYAEQETYRFDSVVVDGNKEDVAQTIRSVSNSNELSTTGDNIIIGIFDRIAPLAHQDFADTLSFVSPHVPTVEADNHATQVAGIITSIAPDVLLHSHRYTELPPMRDNTIDIGVHVWGEETCRYVGEYSFDAQTYDTYEMPLVFSAGNTGSSCPDKPNGYGTIFRGGQSSKNVITVGATDGNGNLAYFSSKGPTLDGRIAPTVVLPGESILSTCGTNGYCISSGTSFSAPGVAGIIAQLLEQQQLSTAAVRALITNTSDDLGNMGPDYDYGYGRVNALAASANLNNIIEDAMSAEEVKVFTFAVAENQDLLKTTLAWNDVPARIKAAVTLVNDLNLVLIAPDGTKYDPFILDPANPSAPATTGMDNRNTIEQIVINNPMAGNWEMVVSAESDFDSQAFAVTHMTEGSDVPLGDEPLLGEALNIGIGELFPELNTDNTIPTAVTVNQVDATVANSIILLLIIGMMTIITGTMTRHTNSNKIS